MAVVGPGRDREGRFLQRATPCVEHKRSVTWSADPAQAGQAIHMCDLDRAGTKSVTSPAVKDSRQRDGDSPDNDEQTSWLRQRAVLLACWDIWQRTDLTCSNLMREVTRATCGTLARAPRAVRYVVH